MDRGEGKAGKEENTRVSPYTVFYFMVTAILPVAVTRPHLAAKATEPREVKPRVQVFIHWLAWGQGTKP